MEQLINILARFKQWILSIVKCRFFLYKRYFHFQPFIYIDNNGNVVKGEVTDKMKWLDDDYIIKEYCLKRAMKIAQNKVSKKYKGDIDAVWFF